MDGIEAVDEARRMVPHAGRVSAFLLASLALASCAVAAGPTLHPASDPTGPPRLLVRLNSGVSGWPGYPGQRVTDYLTDGTVIRVHERLLEIDRLTDAGLARVTTRLAAAAALLATPLRIAPRSTILPMDSTRNMPMGLVEPVNTFVLERADGTRYAVTAPDRAPSPRTRLPMPTSRT